MTRSVIALHSPKVRLISCDIFVRAMIQFRRIVPPIEVIENIAVSRGVRELKRLRRVHGGKRWRKVKGSAYVELVTGEIRLAEFHGTKRTELARRKSRL